MTQQNKDVAFQMLQDIISHFSSNPLELRSLDYLGNCKYACVSNRPKSIGCAIGMYIPQEDALKLDDTVLGGNTVYSILREKKRKLIPKWMKNLDESFLEAVQALHDSNSYWTDYNISSFGINEVKCICNRFDLPFDQLKFKK